MTTATDHARSIFAWLETVAADPELPATASRLAIILTRYINRQTGDAWPSVARLASDLGVVENCVRKSLQSMAARGHILIEPGGGNSSNRYRIKTDDPCTPVKGAPLHENEGVTDSTPAQTCTPPLHAREGHPCTPVKTNHSTNHIIEPSEKKTLSPPVQKSSDDGFDLFWSTYPKRVVKPAALKAWRAALKTGASPDQIIDGARRYAAERAAEPDPTKRVQFTAHAATWLNGRRWQDTPAPVSTTASAPRRNPDGLDSFRRAGLDLSTFEIESQ